MTRHWNTLSSALVQQYGAPVYRIGIDASFSCPNRGTDRSGGCIYCDGTGASAVYQRGADDGVSPLVLASVAEQIERGRRFIRYRYHSELPALYFQAWSNTYAPPSYLKRIYDHALSFGPFVQFIVSTRPDCIDEEVVSLLSSYIRDDMEVWVELGLQSSSNETLKRIHRGHDTACFERAAAMLHAAGIKVTAHIMLMPCFDSRQDYLEAAAILNRCRCEGVKIHNLLVCRNTELERMYLEEGCLTLSSVRRHVEDVSLFLAHLSPGTVIERLTGDMTEQRLTAPLHYPDKRDILAAIDEYMEKNGLSQGSLLETLA